MFIEKIKWIKPNKQQKQDLKENNKILFDNIMFNKTKYTSTFNLDKRELLEYRSENDSRRLWVDRDFNFFED